MDWLRRILGRSNPDVGIDWDRVLETALQTVEAMARPAVALEPLLGDPVPAAAVSSIGGRPSLPAGWAWPRDPSGAPMLFLAQINYAEMPNIPGFPETGLLSFWVDAGDLFGCAFPSRRQQGFRNFWFAAPEGLARTDPPHSHSAFTPYDEKLEQTGAPLAGMAARGLPGPGCHEIDALAEGWLDDCPPEIADEFLACLSEARPDVVYYGGFPAFAQYDFRKPGEDPKLSEVILQMGHGFRRQKGWGVSWGDAGEATFLLTKADLRARAFDRAVYYWDSG